MFENIYHGIDELFGDVLPDEFSWPCFLKGAAIGFTIGLAALLAIATAPGWLAVALTLGLAAWGVYGIGQLVKNWGNMTDAQKSEAMGGMAGGLIAAMFGGMVPTKPVPLPTGVRLLMTPEGVAVPVLVVKVIPVPGAALAAPAAVGAGAGTAAKMAGGGGEGVEPETEKTAKEAKETARKEKLKEGIKEAESKGRLDDLDPDDRTWLEVEPRRKELAFDPDCKSFRVNEAKAALKAEQDGILDSPVTRAIDENGKSGGSDFIDGKGMRWDHKDARAGTDGISDVAAPKGGEPGENVLVDCSDLTPVQQLELENGIKGNLKPGSGEVRFVPKR